MTNSVSIFLWPDIFHFRCRQGLVLLFYFDGHWVRPENNGIGLLGEGRLKLERTAGTFVRHGEKRTRGNVRHLGVLARFAFQTLQTRVCGRIVAGAGTVAVVGATQEGGWKATGRAVSVVLYLWGLKLTKCLFQCFNALLCVRVVLLFRFDGWFVLLFNLFKLLKGVVSGSAMPEEAAPEGEYLKRKEALVDQKKGNPISGDSRAETAYWSWRVSDALWHCNYDATRSSWRI